jgi:site-specific recombinase XerD
VDELLNRYLLAVNPTPSVRRAVSDAWPRFVRYCGPLDPAKLRPAHLEGFQQRLLWEPGPNGKFYSPNTVDQFLRRVRQVLRWASSEGILKHDPSSCLLLPRPPQPAVELISSADLQRLCLVPDSEKPLGLRDAIFLALLIETDLGLTGILEIAVGAPIELEDISMGILAAYLEKARPHLVSGDCPTLLVNSRGGPWQTQSARQRLQEMANLAGLGKFTVRALRRSYLAQLAKHSS